MYPSYLDFYEKLIPAGLPLLDRIGAFLGGKKATLESLKDPYGISEMDDPVLPSFVTPAVSEPPAPTVDPRVFDNTLEGQYQRYFQTPEMDYVFGSGARGKDAPKDASAMEVLGNQLQAPAKDTNISSMYAAQSAMGRVNQDAIQKMYEGDERMQKWAEVNRMLAQREYLKAKKREADQMPLGLDNVTAYGDLGTRAQYDNPMGKEASDLIKKQLLTKASAK